MDVFVDLVGPSWSGPPARASARASSPLLRFWKQLEARVGAATDAKPYGPVATADGEEEDHVLGP